MSAKKNLKRALNAIDEARTTLTSALRNTEAGGAIRRALSELDSAETKIKRAIKEIPSE